MQLSVLRGFTGEDCRLSPSSLFFHSLARIPDYELRLECLLFRRLFENLLNELQPHVVILKKAVRELLGSRALGRLLLLIVKIGNYLNHGGSQGNAAAFKLNSLWRVVDLRSNKGVHPTLLHFIAQVSLFTCLQASQGFKQVYFSQNQPWPKNFIVNFRTWKMLLGQSFNEEKHLFRFKNTAKIGHSESGCHRSEFTFQSISTFIFSHSFR